MVQAQGFDNGKTCESVTESRYDNDNSKSIVPGAMLTAFAV